MTKQIDLVADLGEGFGNYTAGDDKALLEIVTSANIACGFHAGDPSIMRETVHKCVELGVSIGAHPGFPDLRGFGRYAIDLPASVVRDDCLYQIGALDAFCREAGTKVFHIAPHGRLGNLTGVDRSYAEAVVTAARSFSPTVVVLGQEGELTRSGERTGLPVAKLGVIDRAYEDNGQLVHRSKKGAVLHDADEIANRAVKMVTEGAVDSVNGKTISVSVQSLLLHGDEPQAVHTAKQVRNALIAAGVDLAPLPLILDTEN